MSVRGAERLTIRSIRTDRKVPLRSVEQRFRFVYCISLGKLRKKFRVMLVRGVEAPLTQRLCSLCWYRLGRPAFVRRSL